MPPSRTEQQNSGGAQLETIGCAAVVESALLSLSKSRKYQAFSPRILGQSKPVKTTEDRLSPIIIAEENLKKIHELRDVGLGLCDLRG